MSVKQSKYQICVCVLFEVLHANGVGFSDTVRREEMAPTTSTS